MLLFKPPNDKKFRSTLLPQASVIKLCNKFTNISYFDWLFCPSLNWYVQNMQKNVKTILASPMKCKKCLWRENSSHERNTVNNSSHANDILYKILRALYSLLSFCCLSVVLYRGEAFRMSEENEVVSSAKPRSALSKMAKPKNPKYTEMVEDAIKFYNEKGGSSRQAILKYITGKYLVGENAKNQVKLALVKSVGKGRLVQTKGVGASGSFKLSKEVKEEAKKEEKKRLKRERKALKDKENTAPESDSVAKKSKGAKVKKRGKNDGEEKESKKKKAVTKKTKQSKETTSKDSEKKKSKSKEKKTKSKVNKELAETVKEKKSKKPLAKAKTSKIK